MPTILDAKQLAELRQTMIGYAEHGAYTNAFRLECEKTAGLIGALLAGRGDRTECGSAIDHVLGPMAGAEIERNRAAREYGEHMADAHRARDTVAWATAFKHLLDHLSESDQMTIMDYVAAFGGDEAKGLLADHPIVHPAPHTIQ